MTTSHLRPIPDRIMPPHWKHELYDSGTLHCAKCGEQLIRIEFRLVFHHGEVLRAIAQHSHVCQANIRLTYDYNPKSIIHHSPSTINPWPTTD